MTTTVTTEAAAERAHDYVSRLNKRKQRIEQLEARRSGLEEALDEAKKRLDYIKSEFWYSLSEHEDEIAGLEQQIADLNGAIADTDAEIEGLKAEQEPLAEEGRRLLLELLDDYANSEGRARAAVVATVREIEKTFEGSEARRAVYDARRIKELTEQLAGVLVANGMLTQLQFLQARNDRLDRAGLNSQEPPRELALWRRIRAVFRDREMS